ncbi:hypothetical protein NEMIN01_1589 [Nematocida minor]|uniref:uncharacterized protein n=1 Tax=Nematocida minor TaxID=1912983 RepID=UPI00221E6932|nr:uncharacterized protein NEMIN01_1589 [Nematocida minor]KAI5191605.1 hypothetical protein NEMIN01_1589 [Nematocida minor]
MEKEEKMEESTREMEDVKRESEIKIKLEKKTEAAESAGAVNMSKDHKKALSNFRDQVRYKDYKGLIKTLKTLEEIIRAPERYHIEEKYKNSYKMVHENILLLKNILISDIKYSVTNEKGLDKSAVLLSTILAEKYVSDVQRSIVTWMSNCVQTEHMKDLQRLEKLSEVESALNRLLMIKDSIGIKTAHLPIWWNISKVILCDLSVILKNKLIRVMDRAEFSCIEYLDALKRCMDFETTYLSSLGRRSNNSPREVSVLKLSETSPTHLRLLDDISTEHPMCSEEIESNSLTLAFIPYIHIYIENEIKSLSDRVILFSGCQVHSTTYSVYTLLTHTLSKLVYFKFPSVGYSFLTIVDKAVAKIIKKSTFTQASKNLLSGIETVYYIQKITAEMLEKLQKTFNIAGIDSPETEDALNDLLHRIYASYMLGLRDRLAFLNRKVLKSQKLDKHCTPFLNELISEVESMSTLSFTRYDYLVKEWLDMLGESIFLALVDVKFNAAQAEHILYFMSALEVPLKNTIFVKLRLDIQYSIFDKIKIFLKLFLLDPSLPELFIENFHMLSNGLFAFHQVLSKIPKRHRKTLIAEFNKTSSQTI